MKLPKSLAVLGLVLGLVSCAPRRELIIALDAAYAATRPGFAASLAALRPRGVRLRYLELPLSDGPSTLAALLREEKTPALALAASPLIVRALLEGEERQGGGDSVSLLNGAPLVALEWPLASDSALIVLESDPLPAYRAAGLSLGAQVAALRAAGETGAEGAIIWREGRGRSAAAFGAFVDSFTEAAGFPPLTQLLEPSDEENAAERAVRSLLELDLRALLVAAGTGSAQALRSAAGPDRSIGVVSSDSSYGPEVAFRIEADDEALAQALLKIVTGEAGDRRPVPYRIRILPPAREFEAGGLSLEARLEGAQRAP